MSEKKRVILFTANVQGGILQLTLQLYKTLIEEGFDVKVIIPFEIRDIDISVVTRENLLQYHKEKKVIDKTPYKRLASKINEIEPNYVWYMDDSVICSSIGIYLQKNIKQLLILHDAGTHHPTNHRNLRSILVEKYTELVNMYFYKKVYRFVLLSPESIKTFSRLYPHYKEKALKMTLGAHLPNVEELKPSEMNGLKDYILFFGRIDKYKGIENLLKAYCNVSHKSLPLVIAGVGKFTDEEKILISKCNNLTVINRYIADGEMKWMLHHMTAAVLPYIEATQSGVIPLAYLFGKPVIVSNVAGLVQFVKNGETGMICDTQRGLENALVKVSQGDTKGWANGIRDYYIQHMDWDTNIRGLFEKL